MTAITHLFLAQSVDTLAGTKKNYTEHKDDPPEMEKFMNENQNQSEPEPLVITPPILEMKRVFNSCQIKEEPPNAPRIIKPSPYRGKTLNFQRRIKANLLSLGADYTVSRSKLSQGRGYDADIRTRLFRIKTPSRTVLFFLHCGFIPMGFPGKVLTRQQLVGAQETKANCSSSTTTWITFSSQLENTSKWKQPSIRLHEGDIKFTSLVNPNLTCLDLRALFGGLRSNREELSYKPNWYVFLIHQRSSGNWIRTKPRSDEKVIQFLNQTTLDLPYMEYCGFGCLQSHVWRPGDILNQEKIDALIFYSTSMKTSCCFPATRTTRHLIPHIVLMRNHHLPYLEPRRINQPFNSQRIFLPSFSLIMKTLCCFQNVSRHSSFGPKLSRLKPSRNLPYLARLLHKFTNGHMHSICTISFCFLVLRMF